MMAFLILTCISFSLFGFIIGLWADNFEKLQLIPLLVITPLVFLGGSFYSVEHAAARLADRHAVQSGGLPDQRFSLEFFRSLRCQRRTESVHGAGVPRHLPADRVVDVQDRLSIEAIARIRLAQAAA